MGSSEKQRCNMAFAELLHWQQLNERAIKEFGCNRSWHKGQNYLIKELFAMFAEIFGDNWPVDRCQYCGDIMDGDVCGNSECSINQEAA